MQIARGIPFPSRCSSARLIDCRKAFTEISDAVCGSNIRWRGRSFAASIPSDSSKPQRENKRISKDERRAMVKSLVDKYRALNDGKFPKPSFVKKQVGGSYYVIKYILQELEYQSKAATIDKRDETLSKKEKNIAEKARESLGEDEEISTSKISAAYTSFEPSSIVEDDSQMIIIKSKENEEATSKQFEVKNKPKKPTTDDPSSLAGINDPWLKLEVSKSSHPCSEVLEDSNREEATSKDLLDINGPKEEIVNEAGKKSPASDKVERDISRKENEEDQFPKRSTVWGNLKSIADGIINLWRKM